MAKLRAPRHQHLVHTPTGLEQALKFPDQLSGDLEGGLSPLPLAEYSHHRENMPTLCPPGWVLKVNELEFVKCFEIRDERPYEVKSVWLIIKLPCLRSDGVGARRGRHFFFIPPPE